ncbi:DUF2634 domain-containing protein [Acetobacterium tundrae]|uniref:DUF2634 domain-containing protein n=1 Tax=Acetobacterium tundrae TaxID=132932 RepID=A0ABR6WND4_9FIRM|nr:DUF2634 domain-containing protein [Acetobacterium tundrae]MBC3798017.1 DUF2634 domain-containing protein [Acetobacterium tundrae]
MAQLFPTFTIPQMITKSNSNAKNQNVTSYYFDFEKGDFRIDGAGKSVMASPVETWIHWCIKAVNTERYNCRAYSKNYGAEWSQLDGYDSQKAKESWIERTITETLLADPLKRTSFVKNFVYDWDTDSGIITFAVVGQKGMEATLYVQL